MRTSKPLEQVGAPHPDLRTSPILDETEHDEQAASRDVELEEPACYFNGTLYPIGTFVQSGSEVLKCADGGVWARVGEKPPG
ncbi:MAG TPA: hypothetical protein VK043_03630 [Burkholderiales bacterium]|nr:hypothetical protein [Burkholderiales bacterium]